LISITAQISKAHIMLSHIENGAPKAISAALNRTVDGVRADVVREVTETYDIRAKDVRANVGVKKSNLSTLRAAVYGKGSPIPLINFRVTPSKPGQQRPGTVLRASVKRSGGLPIPGAFVARFKSGHAGVLRRTGKARLPVRELFGPALPQMMGGEKVRKEVLARAEERFGKRLDHEIARLLKKG